MALRGENGQPGAFSMFYDEVEDVLAAAEYLAKLPDVDPARVFVSGHSAPHLRNRPVISYNLPHDEFVEELRRLKEAIAEMPEDVAEGAR